MAPGQTAAPTGPVPLSATPGPEPAVPPAEVRLEVGRLGAPHGLDGQMRLHLTTDDPEHLTTVREIFLDGEDAARQVTGFRWHGQSLLIQLAGITTPEAARAVTGRRVRIAGADARPLAAGEYFLYQLIGLRAERATGELVGTVTDLLETGANDVLVITPEPAGPPLLVPNIPEMVPEILPHEGRMIVTLPTYYGE